MENASFSALLFVRDLVCCLSKRCVNMCYLMRALRCKEVNIYGSVCNKGRSELIHIYNKTGVLKALKLGSLT